MSIIEFKKQSNKTFDYDAVRESILGEGDLLNIRDSLKLVCSDWIGATDEQLDQGEKDIREILESILSKDELAKFFNDQLLNLDAFIGKDGGGELTRFANQIIGFGSDSSEIEFHILQVGYLRFIKAIRLDNKIFPEMKT